jgi:hypothetical protein
MSRIVQQSRRVETVSYALAFDYADEPGSGFIFDCDAQGRVVDLAPAGQANYERCVTNTHERPLIAQRILKSIVSYREPAVLKCDCGAHLSLADSMTNECACGAFYNGSGQALCHPSLWGEETGERFDDSGYLVL